MSDGTGVAFRPLTLADLRALQLPDQAWAVDGLLPLGALTLLSAREKAGKGLLSVDLCCSVALAEPFLGRAVRQGTAVYVALEEHIRDVRDRFLARAGDEAGETVRVLPLNGFTEDRLKLNDAAAMNRLLAMIRELSPVLVVLDTLRELHDLQEDSADEMGPLLRPLREIAHATETAILLNHHQNKGGGTRGSTAIAAAADQLWAFHRAEEADGDQSTPRGTLRIEGRYGPRHTLSIRLGERLRWEPATPLLVVGEADTRGRILAFLKESNEGKTAEEIAAGIGKALGTVQNLMTALRKERPCQIALAGKGTKGDPRVYRAVAPRLWPVEEGDENGAIHHPVPDPLGRRDGMMNGTFHPDSSGRNGSNPGPGRDGCLDCGAPVAPDHRYYCALHAGVRQPWTAQGSSCSP